MEKFGFVLATKMLVEGKRKVRYMYHEEATTRRIADGGSSVVMKTMTMLTTRIISQFTTLIPFLKSTEVFCLI